MLNVHREFKSIFRLTRLANDNTASTVGRPLLRKERVRAACLVTMGKGSRNAYPIASMKRRVNVEGCGTRLVSHRFSVEGVGPLVFDVSLSLKRHVTGLGSCVLYWSTVWLVELEAIRKLGKDLAGRVPCALHR